MVPAVVANRDVRVNYLVSAILRNSQLTTRIGVDAQASSRGGDAEDLIAKRPGRLDPEFNREDLTSKIVFAGICQGEGRSSRTSSDRLVGIPIGATRDPICHVRAIGSIVVIRAEIVGSRACCLSEAEISSRIVSKDGIDVAHQDIATIFARVTFGFDGAAACKRTGRCRK
jgi:hypothetical protein